MFNCFSDKVKCADCKCWLDKKDAQEVKESYRYYPAMVDRLLYYCPIHKKKYTRVSGSSLSSEMYLAELEVDKDGCPVGYVKKVNK